MTIVRLVFVSRRIGTVLLVVVVATVLSWRFGGFGIEIDLGRGTAPLVLVNAEVISLGVAIVAAWLTRSRFWVWERLGGPRTKIVAGGVTALGMAAALIPLAAALATVEAARDTPRAWYVANALTLSGAVFLLATLLPPLVAGALVAAGHLANGLIDYLSDDPIAWLPLTVHPGPSAQWVTAVVLPIAAIAVATAMQATPTTDD